MRRFAEGPTELAAEVRTGQACGTGEILHSEMIEVPRVGEVFGTEQMARGVNRSHSSV